MALLSYCACTIIACLCAVLLTRGYVKSKIRLLLWSCLCFWGLTLSNLFIFVDLLILPDIDLYSVRLGLNLLSMLLLVSGLVWESR